MDTWLNSFAVIRANDLIQGMQLTPPNIWLNRLKNRYNDNSEIVCRTLLHTRTSYQSYIKKYNLKLSPLQQACIDSMPDYVWISEVSLPNIYSANKHKLGDIIVRADAK
jgi:hypothetical protein